MGTVPPRHHSSVSELRMAEDNPLDVGHQPSSQTLGSFPGAKKAIRKASSRSASDNVSSAQRATAVTTSGKGGWTSRVCPPQGMTMTVLATSGRKLAVPRTKMFPRACPSK